MTKTCLNGKINNMEKPIICENTTVYDYNAHYRFNMLMTMVSNWIMYAISMLLGIGLIVVYAFMKASVVLIFAVAIIIIINLMKFWFQPRSLKKTYADILAVRGEMVFVYRFHEDGFDQLCRSSKGESSVEIGYAPLKKIIETNEDILFVTKQNTAYYMRKDDDYAYENEQLSKRLATYKQYKFVGKKKQADVLPKEDEMLSAADDFKNNDVDNNNEKE